MPTLEDLAERLRALAVEANDSVAFQLHGIADEVAEVQALAAVEPPDRRWFDRDIIEAAVAHAVRVHEDQGVGLTPHGIAQCAASLALVLSDPSHPNHALALEQHVPPAGVENGVPYDAYCECGYRVKRRMGAWICPTHYDRATVVFRRRPGAALSTSSEEADRGGR